jgi:hypothetical protein
VKLALFGIGWCAIERDHVNQQRRRGQTIPGIVKRPMLVGGGRNYVGDELAESVEHHFLLKSSDGLYPQYMDCKSGPQSGPMARPHYE